jgi:hypothetical protein
LIGRIWIILNLEEGRKAAVQGIAVLYFSRNRKTSETENENRDMEILPPG